MAIPYPQPNWIKPADPASHFARGYGLGLQGGQAQAQINMERARLAEAQNRTALTIALRQQELERQSMVDQQKLEVDKAYKAQQFSLAQQELGIKEQEMQQKIKEAAARSLAMNQFRNEIAQGTDPRTAYLRQMAGVPGLEAGMSTALSGEKLTPEEQYEEGINRAQAAGNTNLVSLLKTAQANKAAGDEFMVRQTPAGLELYKGPNATKAMQGKGQEKLAQYESALAAMNSLQKQLKPGDVGIKGKLGQVVVDEAMAQFFPNVAVGQRIEGRTALGLLKPVLMGIFADDIGGRSSAAERKEIAKSLPDTDVLESYETIENKLKTIRQRLGERGAIYSKYSGQEQPLWSRSKEEIISLKNSGKISYEDALRALMLGH